MERIQQWFKRLGMAIVVTMFAFGGASVAGAQDMFCDTDPIIHVVADDGAKINLQVMYRAPLVIGGNAVPRGQMVSHLRQNSTATVVSAVRNGAVYDITIRTSVDVWDDETTFPVISWLVHKPSKEVGAEGTYQAGSQTEVFISVPAKKGGQSGW